MRDQDVTTPTTPEQMTFADDPGTPPAEPTDVAEPTPEELQAAELSRAAREAVRQPADPRIDRQLARMGLADDEDTTQNGLRAPARSVRAEDVDRIEEELAATRAALAAAERRVNLVTWVVTLEGIAVAILAVLLLLR
jgi:hypothetical protein